MALVMTQARKQMWELAKMISSHEFSTVMMIKLSIDLEQTVTHEEQVELMKKAMGKQLLVFQGLDAILADKARFIVQDGELAVAMPPGTVHPICLLHGEDVDVEAVEKAREERKAKAKAEGPSDE